MLPLTIDAEPIFVDYEGVVGSLFTEEGSPPITGGFHVGQRIKGRLTIDTGLAGPDNAAIPSFGTYGFRGADFITGEFDISLAGSSRFDVVNVSSYSAPEAPPYYAIFDQSVIDLVNATRFQIVIEGIPLANDGLRQAFTAEPKKDGSRISSILQWAKNGVSSAVRFVFDKVSVTPQSCRV
jgi:hypothetical protein